MSVVAPSSMPLISGPALQKVMPSNVNQLIAARRLALIGDARVHVAPLVFQPAPGSSLSVKGPSKSTVNSSISNNDAPQSATQSASSKTLSSVARRKQRLANDSVPSSAYAIPSPGHHAASPSQSSTSSGAASHMSRNILELAPVGVVDMRFLIRQPPTVQKAASIPRGQKPGSKSSSVGTPTSPAGLLSVTTPKNQRPKSTGRVAAAAVGNPQSSPSDQAEVTLLEPEKEVNKHLKHAFLFRPDSEQPPSGPFVRYSPMYHYYHPYRNLHREAIKTEWARLHPIVERAPPQLDEQVVTPPRRTSGRHKKGTNGRGTTGKGKDKKKGVASAVDPAVATVEGEGGAANAIGGDSQGNDATAATPPPTNGRRSRANGKGKGGAAKGPGKGKNTRNAVATKRKRTEFEDEEKAGLAKEDVTPTPPTKRPRRGAAAASALASALAAQETGDDAGSPKDDLSHADGQDDSERRVVKRRMRPNARKTAAARAAAMEAKVSSLHLPKRLVAENRNRKNARMMTVI